MGEFKDGIFRIGKKGGEKKSRASVYEDTGYRLIKLG
jgi:hypothetical protein